MNSETILLVDLPRMLEDMVRQIFEKQYHIATLSKNEIALFEKQLKQNYLALITFDSEDISSQETVLFSLRNHPESLVVRLGNHGTKADLLRLRLETESYEQVSSTELSELVARYKNWEVDFKGKNGSELENGIG